MTPQELLIPRYKVVAGYPNSLYQVGYIINESDNLEGATFFKVTVHQYPHLFKKLEWWEERSVEDMPEYIEQRGQIFKVAEWHTDLASVVTVLIDYKIHTGWIPDCTETPLYGEIQPVTEEEYNNFKSKKSEE